MSNEVGGNTDAVTGTVVVAGNRFVSGSFGINVALSRSCRAGLLSGA